MRLRRSPWSLEIIAGDWVLGVQRHGVGVSFFWGRWYARRLLYFRRGVVDFSPR